MTDENKKQNDFENWYYKKYPVTLNIGEEYRLEQMNDCFNAGVKCGTEIICKKILEEVEHNVEVSSETTEGFVIGKNQLREIIKDLETNL